MQIISRQISGLGNQLFQYAAGRYYATRYGASMEMAIDPPERAVSHGYPRPFLLTHFSIPVPLRPMTAVDRLMLSQRGALRPMRAVAGAAAGIRVFRESVEQRYRFLPDLPEEVRGGGVRSLYLAGYWQAHSIVDGVGELLRKELAFREPPVGKNLEMQERIRQCSNPVSLHVRRGDYTLASEGNIALPMTYYERAIAHFQQRLSDPVFFVFSDDIAYTREHLPKGIETVFVDHNDDATSHEDMRLMSSCHHHVLANSTFSWWGAWLNARPDKMVYAPKFWHLHSRSYYPDLMPPEWTLAEA